MDYSALAGFYGEGWTKSETYPQDLQTVAIICKGSSLGIAGEEQFDQFSKVMNHTTSSEVGRISENNTAEAFIAADFNATKIRGWETITADAG